MVWLPGVIQGNIGFGSFCLFWHELQCVCPATSGFSNEGSCWPKFVWLLLQTFLRQTSGTHGLQVGQSSSLWFPIVTPPPESATCLERAGVRLVRFNKCRSTQVRRLTTKPKSMPRHCWQPDPPGVHGTGRHCQPAFRLKPTGFRSMRFKRLTME